MKTADYLDALRARLNLPSDYAAAKALNCTRAAVSAYRNCRSTFDDATALRVAELLGIDPQKVIADMHAERAKDAKVRAFWQQVASAAAAVVLGVTLGAAPPQARASVSAAGEHSAAESLCVMSNYRH